VQNSSCSLEGNLLHCTLIYTKADTKAMASTTTATLTAALSAACGPAAWACGIAAGLVIDTVKRAAAQGKCFGIQRLTTAAPVYPVIVTCRR
jgi:hypothetical protein